MGFVLDQLADARAAACSVALARACAACIFSVGRPLEASSCSSASPVGRRKTRSPRASTALANLLQHIPDNAIGLEIAIHPDQDGEGTFAIHARLTGPDQHVLNKAVAEFADLLSVKHTPSGPEPPVPLLDPFDVDFVVQDVVAQCCTELIRRAWLALGNPEFSLPVTVVNADMFASSKPVVLHP